MEVLVNVKQLGARRDKVSGVPFELRCTPQSVGELIAAAVGNCVRSYNARLAQQDAAPLDEERLAAMESVGKITFGLLAGGKAADAEQALAHALQAYEDGLFRLFIGTQECGGLADSITLHEGDSLTFIRLTMLTGGIHP